MHGVGNLPITFLVIVRLSSSSQWVGYFVTPHVSISLDSHKRAHSRSVHSQRCRSARGVLVSLAVGGDMGHRVLRCTTQNHNYEFEEL